MPTNEEVKVPEGASAAQHRFRLSVNANPSDMPPENGPSSATTNGPRQPPDAAGNGPFLYAQLPYRNSRYKEKFQALREKYDRVIAKQEEYHHDLEIATAKIKKLQAENDLLLDAMNLAAAQQPSMFGFLPPALPLDAPSSGDTPMDVDAFVGSSGGSAAPLLAERPPPPPPPRHVNGNGNGHSSNGTRSASSNSSFGPVQTNGTHPPLVEQSRPPSIEFIAHDMNGRGP
ncbi:hypothetical protein B0H11DRAFT_2005943 [Mycena galericulata]|nr:hypothetical protein B0H11DRAFT_2005943 [Mycena galericulata]